MAKSKKCPYCGTEMKEDPFAVTLPRKRKQIFRIILNAGEEGIQQDALDAKLYDKGGKSSVRSAIHYINKAIYPLKIEGKGGYRVIRLD